MATSVANSTSNIISTNDPNIKIVEEERVDDQGRQVKVTRKIQTRLIQTKVLKSVADRKKWVKFGDAFGNKPGPDIGSTLVGEQVFLKLAVGKDFDVEEFEVVDKSKQKKISCRLCKGDHFTTKCPFKDSLKAVENIESAVNAASLSSSTPAATTGKYIPPSLRAGAKPARDDSCTLRVANLSETITERDLHTLFSRFGATNRVFLAKDKDTGLAKGYAFVSFYDRESAEKALKKLNGHGFDNLIMKVEWSKPSE